MIVTTEHIGEILCRHDTGARFQVTDVTDTGLSILSEDGVRDQLSSHTVNGEVVHDEEQINSFHQNLKLAQSLLAAEQAAQRRMTSGQINSPASEEASRVSQIIQEQLNVLRKQLCAERTARQGEHTHSFDALFKSAKDRTANQHSQQQKQPMDLKR